MQTARYIKNKQTWILVMDTIKYFLYIYSQEENSFEVILKKSCHFLITSHASLIK